MYSIIPAALSLLAATAAASPLAVRSTTCMCAEEAARVANNFRDLIHFKFNTTLANDAFTVDFVDYADSVNELINNGCPAGPAPLTQPTFSSRAAFIAGQSGQAPIPFKILNLWNNCNTVIMRWRSGQPAKGLPVAVYPEEPVTGIVVMETVSNPAGPEPWVIQTVYSEFNSGAWLYDLGIFKPTCS